MRKLFLTAALCATTLAASAQHYVGGSLSLSYNQTGESESDAYVGELGFTISPQYGYAINEKWDAGLYLNYGISNERDVDNEGDKVSVTSQKVGVTPYARYYFATVKKARFYVEGMVGFSYISESASSNTLGASVRFRPGVSFELNERFALELDMDFLSLGYSFSSEGGKNSDNRDLKHSFDCAFSANNLMGELGTITIGMLYKF